MTDTGNRPPGLNYLDHAACKGLDPNLFIVPDSHATGRRAGRTEPDMSEARAVCATCPVGAECERDGTSDMWAVRNGKTPRERGASARDASKPIAHGTEGGARAHRRVGQLPCELCAAGAALACRLRKERARAS